MNIPQTDYVMRGIDNLNRMHSKEIRRLLVLDAANIISGTSVQIDRYQRVFKLLGLVSLMRIFVKLKFDVIVCLSRKFIAKDVLDPRIIKAFWKLNKFDLIKLAGQNTLDDLDMLEIAAATGGVVISQDQFRDHSGTDARLAEIVRNSTARVDYDYAPDHVAHKFTQDGHYLALGIFRLSAHEKYFTKPGDPRYELVKYTRKSWSEEKQKKIMDVLDEIIEIARPIEYRPRNY